MNKLIEKINVKSIVIDPEYSLSGKKTTIQINDNGLTLSINAISNIRQLSNMKKVLNIKEYYSSFFNTMNLDMHVNYSLILGDIKSNEYLNYLKEIISTSLKILSSYHTEIFPKRKKCYLNLADVFMNGKLLEKPIYNHSGVTGRTSIKKGFNFLTLKKELRSSINSVKGTRLVEVDFKSCEPFFYLLSQGFQIEGDDVYEWVARKYNININNRDRTKKGILSMIYGANDSTISRIMNIKEEKINKIKKELGIYSLKNRLEKEFQENGFVLNYYGRPITSDNNLVNYWIQSSTVDYCSLSFLEFYTHNNFKPAYFIHDSMTIIVPDNRLEEIKELKYLKESISKIKIPVEYSIIS